ncbi:hypothetical protein SBA4_1330007 [Candidatus Sulfopaludibacter sp. SbA4]|nr:hypothetical protein SBA4_1330007 [Candidatus Sulfopaludibacter sp. SbA4]
MCQGPGKTAPCTVAARLQVSRICRQLRSRDRKEAVGGVSGNRSGTGDPARCMIWKCVYLYRCCL